MKKLILILAMCLFAATIAAEPCIGDTVQYKTYQAVVTRKTAYYALGDTLPTYTYTIRSTRPSGIQFGRLIYPTTANVRDAQIKITGKKVKND